jgi:hypothetical protein
MYEPPKLCFLVIRLGNYIFQHAMERIHATGSSIFGTITGTFLLDVGQQRKRTRGRSLQKGRGPVPTLFSFRRNPGRTCTNYSRRVWTAGDNQHASDFQRRRGQLVVLLSISKAILSLSPNNSMHRHKSLPTKKNCDPGAFPPRFFVFLVLATKNFLPFGGGLILSIYILTTAISYCILYRDREIERKKQTTCYQLTYPALARPIPNSSRNEV